MPVSAVSSDLAGGDDAHGEGEALVAGGVDEKATTRWSWLTVRAPIEKNSVSPASTLPSTTTSSPGTVSASGSGRTAGSVSGARTCEAYCRPSTVREKYHQGPLAHRHREVGLLDPATDLLEDLAAQRRRGARCGPRRRRSRPRGARGARGPRGPSSRRRGPRTGHRGAPGRGGGARGSAGWGWVGSAHAPPYVGGTATPAEDAARAAPRVGCGPRAWWRWTGRSETRDAVGRVP